MSDSSRVVFEYHEATKHSFNKYAQGPGRLDWSSQPDPFRRYRGAPLLYLERFSLPGGSSGDASDESLRGPFYDQTFTEGEIAAVSLDLRSLSLLLFDSLALSAWKSAGGEAWALRVNPSSGNLHPTEGYVIGGGAPLAGLAQTVVVSHYAPKEHALEIRCELPPPLGEKLFTRLPRGALLVGLTSVHWREAWKYGERAYRYCQLDVGHALGALAIAAGGLGWRTNLLDDPSSEDLARLLGVSDPGGGEPEDPDCLIAVYPREKEDQGESPVFLDLESLFEDFPDLTWQGEPNVLSRSHVSWPAIEGVARAVHKPRTRNVYRSIPIDRVGPFESGRTLRPVSLRNIIHQRRSGVAMDGVTSMEREPFYRMLLSTMPVVGKLPFAMLPWQPCVHLALFVHRVDGLAPGLYFVVRNPRHEPSLKEAMHRKLSWQKPEECPEQLDLYLLGKGDGRRASAQISCHQDIAGEGCFSVAMIAEFEPALSRFGPWFYPRLFWECGMIGQLLYLEAEAAGLRGTGIGCFFDDPTHELLGLSDKRYQDLYHFTVGGPIEDRRITTLPAYPE